MSKSKNQKKYLKKNILIFWLHLFVHPKNEAFLIPRGRKVFKYSASGGSLRRWRASPRSDQPGLGNFPTKNGKKNDVKKGFVYKICLRWRCFSLIRMDKSLSFEVYTDIFLPTGCFSFSSMETASTFGRPGAGAKPSSVEFIE